MGILLVQIFESIIWPWYTYCHSPTQPQPELELDLIMGRNPPPPDLRVYHIDLHVYNTRNYLLWLLLTAQLAGRDLCTTVQSQYNRLDKCSTVLFKTKLVHVCFRKWQKATSKILDDPDFHKIKHLMTIC